MIGRPVAPKLSDPKVGNPAGTMRDASELCVGCGLCCDGSLYGHVKLEAEDRARLAAVGAGGLELLLHPCRFFGDGRCTVYDIRPSNCRSYSCRVLEDLDAGAIDLGTARSRVEQALALRERMNEATPEGLTAHEMAEHWVASAPGGRDAQRAKAIIAYVAYWTFAERYFLKPGDTRVVRVSV